MADACHHMHHAVGDIGKLDKFAEVILLSRSILSFMSKSNYAMEHFNEARRKLHIDLGLTGIGETRFGTIYWSLESIRRGIPAFRSIVKHCELGINIAVRGHTAPSYRQNFQLVLHIGPE